MRIYVSALLLLLFTGCYKYKEQAQLSNPAYLRVFNSIPYNLDALHAGQAPPFLCFIIDPTFDAAGVPAGGKVVGDWLHTRELFSLSYASDAATAMNAQATINLVNAGLPSQNVTNANYEYPGKLHVLTAPQLNGFDLSAWAQVPSGKHRILFVVRPQDNTPFSQVTATLRNQVLIDTTVDLQAGEVFTMNALAMDLDNAKYGIDLRKEQFVHTSFDPGRLYASFYNLSGITPFLATDPHYPYFWYFSDTLALTYTCWTFDDNYDPGATLNSRSVPGATNVYMSTIIRGNNAGAVFTPLPFPSRSSFFDQQGVLRTLTTMLPNNPNSGTMPYISFDFARTSPVAAQYGHYPSLICQTDPANFNTLDPDQVNNSSGAPLNGPHTLKMFQPNLYRVIQSGSSLNIIPTVNIFEIIYNRIYLMQLQRGYDKVPD